MSELAIPLSARAAELFEQHRKEIYLQTDRLFRWLMAAQWLFGILLAGVLTPYTWTGQTSQIHIHIWAAIFLGGTITLFPIWMTHAWPGSAPTRYVIAVAQMLMSALLIALTGGRIETHFHVFGSLVILSFYRDWRVLAPATLVVALDHFVRGVYWPYSVYGVLTATPLRSLEHAGWVVFEDIFLVISCWRSIREMTAIAKRTAALEAALDERARNEDALREAKEVADRANHAKSEFLSRMSHELRTPLNAILGFGQLIARQNPTEVLHKRVGHILTAGRHLLNLINEVLDISRIEAGNLQFSLEPVSVNESLNEALSLMRPLAAERKIELTMTGIGDEQHYVMADRQRIKQVLLNLLANAVKYTPIEGQVTISFGRPAEKQVRIVVSDNGDGIPEDKLPRLFTAFDRLGAENSTVEGTGLGLALCKRLMLAMHGQIGVQSDLGRGSTFWIELPSCPSPLERSGAEKRRGESSLADGSKRHRLLYIEDNASNLTLVEEMVAELEGVELIIANEGQAGFDLATSTQPDLILLDLHLPDVPGWTVLSRLKADARTFHVPVLVISADATERQMKRLAAAGARGYLTKPIDADEFFTAVEQLLRVSSQQPCVATTVL